MVIHAVDTEAIVKYVPRSERHLPEDEQAYLEVRQFSHREQRDIASRADPNVNMQSKSMSISTPTGELIWDKVRRVIRGYHNFVGVPEAAFDTVGSLNGKTEILKEECAAAIPFPVLAEVFEFVLDGCQLTEDERKN